MDHQTLHVGHIRQQREDLQGIDKFPGLFLTALHFEGEDGTATIGEVLLVELVVVMTLQSGMMHSSHLRMLSEEINHLQGILHMTLHTQTQGLYTLQKDEGVER